MTTGRRNCEWLPSRFNLALFRAVASVVASRPPRTRRGVDRIALAFHHEQHPLETYALATAFQLLLMTYILERFAFPQLQSAAMRIVAVPFAAAAALFIWTFSMLALAIVIQLAGTLTPIHVDRRLRLESAGHHLLALLMALDLGRGDGMAGLIGKTWLGLTLLNLACKVVMAALANRVRTWNSECSTEL